MKDGNQINDDERFIQEIEALAAIGGWELDDDDTLRWTPGTKSIFEVSNSFEPTLASAIEFFHSEDRHQIEQAVNRCREEGVGYDIEVRIVTDDGKTRWVRARGERRTDEGKIRGVLQDITHEKRRRQQLSVLNRALRHNLRNDLNVVQGYAEQLQHELEQLDVPASEARREFAEIIAELRESTRASSDDIKTLSHIIHAVEGFSETQAKRYTTTIKETSQGLVELGQKANDFAEWIDKDPPRKSICLNQIIEEVTHAFRDDYQDVSITVAGENTIHVEADIDGLRLLIEEAIRNAIEHNDVDSRAVTVTARGRHERVQLDIIDNGPGIPDSELAILEQREESPLSHSSGIGLWMLTWIVTRYGGDVNVRPNPPRGTLLMINLPQTNELEFEH